MKIAHFNVFFMSEAIPIVSFLWIKLIKMVPESTDGHQCATKGAFSQQLQNSLKSDFDGWTTDIKCDCPSFI